MRVVIAGAGEIGWYIAQQLSLQGHDVTVIEQDETRVRQVESELDVQVLHGRAAAAVTLAQSGVAEADLLIAATGSDETNLVCASIGGSLGAARTVARVDEVIYRKASEISYRRHFGVDELVSPEMLAALELASRVRNPGSLAVEHFAQGRLEMQQLVADRGAKAVGKPLHTLTLPKGVRVASIHRDEQVIIPGAQDTVEHGDLITIVGQTEAVAKARPHFEATSPGSRKVVIMGGGHTTMSLARRLRSQTVRLTIIERDPNRCRVLAAQLPAATVLNGDGTNLSFLKEERIENADFFISTTGSDEANIMGAMQAKSLGVGEVLVVIHRPDYADLMKKMGIDRAVSPRVVIAREMLTLLQQGNVSTLASLENGRAEILRLSVEGEDFVGRRLRDIDLPVGCLVLTLQRERETLVPQAETVFQLEDIILVICRDDQRKKIIRLVVGQG